uniref:Uncharacterized protein n=1 Tax=Macaca fascicularis TaxID=9541 RepID=A0A7N9CI55_MACFA
EYFAKTVKEDVAVGAGSPHEFDCSSFPQLKEYQQRNSPGVPAGVKTKKKNTGSSPETTTSGGCHSPGDSRYQELEVALDSSSATINQLNENIESLKRQKKQVEHQLEEEKKANNDIHKAQTEQLEVSGGWGVFSCPPENVSFRLFQHLLGFSPKRSIPDNQHPHIGKGRLEDHPLPY